MMADCKHRILGKMLGQYVGKNVIVAGTLTNVNSSGNAIELLSFDNTTINVTLPSAFDGNSEGVYEIWGTAKSRGTMLATQVVHFDEDACKDLDRQKYNDLIVLLNAVGNKWKNNAEVDAL